jgi:GNAT superfamily N-acetyltransferase
MIRASARGVAIRDGDRAVAVAFVADGSLVGSDTIVRFDVTHGEVPARRLADALAATGARSVWFYGGDDVVRRAALELDLQLRPAGGVFVRRMDAARAARVAFRPPAQIDRLTLPEVLRDHAPAFRAPLVEIGEIDRDAVGLIASESLDAEWSEMRVFVQPTYRGQRHGAALLSAAADRIEATGRRVCAAIEGLAGRERSTLEAAGFRLVDYYFTAAKR